MDKELYDKIVKELEERGIEVLGEAKDKRSYPFRFAMWAVGRPLKSTSLIEVRKNCEKAKAIVLQKKTVKQEHQKLSKVNGRLSDKTSFRVPEPILLIEDENILVSEFLDGKTLSEHIVLNNIFIGLSEDELIDVFRKFGVDLAKFQNQCKTGKNFPIHDTLKENFESTKEVLPEDIADRINEIGLEEIEVPKTYIHRDMNLRNILWDGQKIGVIDWANSREGNPLEDLHVLEKSLTNRNKNAFWVDLREMRREFVESYQEEAGFDVDDYMLNVSRLSFLLDKIKSKPRRAQEGIYKTEIKRIVESLE